MMTAHGSDLQRLLNSFNGLDWIHAPGREVDRAITALREFSELRMAVADFLLDAHNNSTSIHQQAAELITRTDVLLHADPRRTFECWLHVNRAVITATSAIRPRINAKGYWQGTVVLKGRLVREDYHYDGPPYETMVQREFLRFQAQQERRAGQAFILPPEQIHRLTEIDQGTITLTVNVLAGATPYRTFTPQPMNLYVIEEREPRQNRLLAIAQQLRVTA